MDKGKELEGWLLDVYAAPVGAVAPARDAAPARDTAPVGDAAPAGAATGVGAPATDPSPRDIPVPGLVAWLLGDDGQRHRLVLPFPVTFYAAGPPGELRLLWRFLRQGAVRVGLQRQERRELFSARPLTVLAVQVPAPALLPDLFRKVSTTFPDLTYFDSDISLPLACAARWDVFPLARCRTHPGESLQALDSPWDLEPPAPPLSVLSIEPDCDPEHAPPRLLKLRAWTHRGASDDPGTRLGTYRLPLQPARPLLINLAAILKRHDPDLLLTSWGDSWLLPMLIERSQELGIPLPLNRDPACEIAHRPERSYVSYGQVIYRDRQVHLFGRWHIDRHNATLWDDYTLEGVLESARVTGLPVQTAARTSPGTGISSMQIVTALRMQVLVPWRKAEPERFKQADDLFSADQGGLVYQPLTGLHANVGMIDFTSMYPGIMVRFNISPETAGAAPHHADELAPLESQSPGALAAPLTPGALRRSASPPKGDGLVPRTLSPLLDKRLELKACLGNLTNWDPRRAVYKARASAHKWLLVTCFGYLGYRNARFGRIEAHEAVTAYGREALLRAKEVCEDFGFTVLHMYVDGLWVKPEADGAITRPAEYEPLLAAITEHTHLPISLDGIFRWVAFLPSRQDGRVPVPNRYFGVFQDGSLKVRGIEVRRHDTPPFIAQTQKDMLEILAQAPDVPALRAYLPQAYDHLQQRLQALRRGAVPLPDLLASLKLSRELEQYRTPSPAARAALQLQKIGKEVRPGQRVRFLYLRGEPDVHAWDLPEEPDTRRIDIAMYEKLMHRAAESVLLPLGGGELLNPVLQPGLFPPRQHRQRLPVTASKMPAPVLPTAQSREMSLLSEPNCS